jgi:hypothetical protein
MFANPSADAIAQLLRGAHTVAIVGLSPDRTRPSHGVARALQRFGYRIIPVNPYAESILGEPAVAAGRGDRCGGGAARLAGRNPHRHGPLPVP